MTFNNYKYIVIIPDFCQNFQRILYLSRWYSPRIFAPFYQIVMIRHNYLTLHQFTEQFLPKFSTNLTHKSMIFDPFYIKSSWFVFVLFLSQASQKTVRIWRNYLDPNKFLSQLWKWRLFEFIFHFKEAKFLSLH